MGTKETDLLPFYILLVIVIIALALVVKFIKDEEAQQRQSDASESVTLNPVDVLTKTGLSTEGIVPPDRRKGRGFSLFKRSSKNEDVQPFDPSEAVVALGAVSSADAAASLGADPAGGTAGLTLSEVSAPPAASEDGEGLAERYERLDTLFKEKAQLLEKTTKELEQEQRNRKDFNKVKDLIEKELKDAKVRAKQAEGALNSAKDEAQVLTRRITQLEEKIKGLEKEIYARDDQLREAQVTIASLPAAPKTDTVAVSEPVVEPAVEAGLIPAEGEVSARSAVELAEPAVNVPLDASAGAGVAPTIAVTPEIVAEGARDDQPGETIGAAEKVDAAPEPVAPTLPESAVSALPSDAAVVPDESQDEKVSAATGADIGLDFHSGLTSAPKISVSSSESAVVPAADSGGETPEPPPVEPAVTRETHPTRAQLADEVKGPMPPLEISASAEYMSLLGNAESQSSSDPASSDEPQAVAPEPYVSPVSEEEVKEFTAAGAGTPMIEDPAASPDAPTAGGPGRSRVWLKLFEEFNPKIDEPSEEGPAEGEVHLRPDILAGDSEEFRKKMLDEGEPPESKKDDA